ncbi:hypothetical protein ACKKBF_B18805 [Auxenochlorella protothecoides x Auxenochlorella symbiontica]
MTELTTAQSLKQSVRQFGLRASDTWKLAGAKTSRSDTKLLDVALVKATTPQTRVPPKEKHVRTLKLAVSGGGGGGSASYVVSHLLQRLHNASDWLTALKSLITIHRLMAETDEGVWEEINRVGAPARGRGPLGVDNFIDTTNIEGRFDFSEFVRAYGKYLDEQLRLYAAVRWTCSAVAAGGPGAGAPGGESAAGYGAAGYGAPPGPADAQRSPGGAGRFRTLPAAELLHQLPLLQRLQRHLVDCVPRGAATHDPVALATLDAVVRESFQLYKALSEGVINLADAYFSMPYLQAGGVPVVDLRCGLLRVVLGNRFAVKGLEIYREASAGTDALSAFYAAVGQLGGVSAARSLPSLTPPPADFVASMEEYLAEAPRPEGEAALPKRSGPLRKGRLAHSASGRAGEGGAASHPRTLSSDPGMVLAPSQEPAGGEEGPDGGSGGGLASPGGAPGSPGAGTGPPRERDLLGSDPGTPARTPAHAAPSPLDLLGGLTLEGLDVAPPAAPGGAQAPPHASANPFAGPDPFAAYGAEPGHGQPTRGADPFALPGAQHAFGFGAQGVDAAPWQAAPPGAPPGGRPPVPPLDTSFFAGLSNGAPTSSPAVLSPGGTTRWTQGAAGTPQGGGEDLVRAAGARDPFATLTTLSPGGTVAEHQEGGAACGGPGT